MPTGQVDLEHVTARASSPAELVSETTSTGSSIEVLQTGSTQESHMGDTTPDQPLMQFGASTPNTTVTNGQYDPTTKCHTILDLEGKSWIAFKTAMPVFLMSYPDVWEVTEGRMFPKPKPEDSADKRTRWNNANTKARRMLFQCMSPQLIANLFYNESTMISAPDIWKRFTTRYSNKITQNRKAIIARFTSFKFVKGKSVEENLQRFADERNLLTESGAVLDPDTMMATLIAALPQGWESIRQSFAARPDNLKSLDR